jgi:hypothetical protein
MPLNQVKQTATPLPSTGRAKRLRQRQRLRDRQSVRCPADAMLYYGVGRESGGTVDAVDSKSTALRAWGFESPLSHQFAVICGWCPVHALAFKRPPS